MDQVAITALPHPVTTFILGILLLGLILLYTEYRIIKRGNQQFYTNLEKVNDNIEKLKDSFDKKLEENSKKIDSRVDKAILIFKQKQNQNK